MSRPVVITCALTGGAPTFRKNPHVPVTPKQIAGDAVVAARAGAAVVHIHARDPLTGAESDDPALFREIVDRIRDHGTDVLINLTTAIGTYVRFDEQDPSRLDPEGTHFLTPEQRTRHVRELRPDICSLDVCVMQNGSDPYINLPQHIRAIARTARATGTKPEIEVFNVGDMVLARELLDEQLFAPPPIFQFVMGVKYGIDATPMSLLALLAHLPQGAHWTAMGIGRHQMTTAAYSVGLGGHVRVGLEDNLRLPDGELATNARLVDQAVTLTSLLGGRPATPAETRALLGLSALASDDGIISVPSPIGTEGERT